MTHPRLLLLPLLPLLGLALPAFGQAAVVQTLPANRGAVAVRADGTFAVASGHGPIVSQAHLMVFGPEWQSSDQTQLSALETQAEANRVTVTGRLVERASGQPWRFTQRLERVDETARVDAVRVDYELAPLAAMTVNELSLVMDLPIARLRGKRLVLHPRADVAFPLEQPPAKHFVSAVASRYVFGADEPWQLGVALDQPRLCNVQDTREWQGDVYQAFVKIIGSRQEVQPGEVYRLSVTLVPNDPGRWTMPKVELKSAQPLRLGAVRLEPETPRVGELATLRVDLQGTWDTPFWAEQVALDAVIEGPEGRTWRVPGFYTLDYTRTAQQAPAAREGAPPRPLEVLTPEGQPGWQVRFLPQAAGEHRVTLQARDRSGQVETTQAIPVADGRPAPFVRVSRTDPHYFEFDDGRPYVAIGQNVCWYREGGTYDYDRWFGALADAGGNYARLWMPEWAMGYEWGPPGSYRLDRAWQMDQILRIAAQRNIYLKVCLENFRTFGPGNPYAKANGGPCETVLDVFRNDEAKRMWRNRLRYAVARWGWSPNVMAWEFWNEIDCVQGYDAATVHAWTQEMARWLRENDPYQHLVVNSLGSFVFEPELWSTPEIDFAQMHGYWHPKWRSTEPGKDMAKLLADEVGRIRAFGKPALFAEFGLVNETWGLSPRSAEDRNGVHLHNGLWGALMAGAAGTGHLWWWDNYIDPLNLWPAYRGVSAFVAGVPFNTERFEPFTADAPEGLRATGLRGETTTLLWVQNRAHTWWNVVEKLPIPPVENVTLALPQTPRGAAGGCRVEVWDPYTGERRSSHDVGAETVTLELGTIERDVAVKVVAGQG